MKRLKQFITLLFFSILSIASFAVDKPSFVLVLDAGHGGKDPGAVGSKIYEKKINLAVILALGEMVEKNHPEVKVVYTRKTDVYLTLQERADIANNAHGDLFISVHTNANNSSAASGTETYTLGLTKSKSNLDVAMRENAVILLEEDYKTKYSGFDPNSVDSYIMFEFMQDNFIDKSQVLASAVQNNFVTLCKRKDKGVRQAGFWVLHKTAMPSILVELGFITNPEEQEFLASTTGQVKLAEAIYQAFVAYNSEYQRKSGNHLIVDKPLQSQEQAKDELKANDAVNTENKDISQRKQTATEDAKVLQNKQQDSKSVSTQTTNVVSPNTTNTSALNKTDSKQPVENSKSSATHTSTSVSKSTATSALSNSTPVSSSVNVERPIYKLQLFAVSKVLPSNSPSFKGLKSQYYLEGGLYKYTYGEEYSYLGIEALKNKVASKFPTAIIVVFYKGKKITLSEAKELEKNK